jgi:hypothetical protein
MKREEHQKALQEHLVNLDRAIDENVEENQRNIGFNVSQASVELFAMYLHALHFIEGSGDQWDHRTFKSKTRLEQKVPPAFREREKILPLMETIERERLIVCYGKRKPKIRIEKMILAFRQLQEIIHKNMPHEQK